MHEKTYFLPVFVMCLVFVFFIVFLGRFGVLGFFTNSVQNVFFPFGQLLHSQSVISSSTVESLQKENANLRKQLVDIHALQADNAALRDQFETTVPSTNTLLPVQVVGMGNAIPNISFPENIIIHAGKKERVNSGNVVIVKNEVVGSVAAVSDHYSVVQLVSSKQSSFPAITSASQAIGVAKGNGNGDIILDNVLLSQYLQVNDTVVTKGNQDIQGKGFPPDLLIGKIVSVDKNPSSLFQKARILPLISFDQLTTVFVVRN
jgi:rod shape-determining protein MreC